MLNTVSTIDYHLLKSATQLTASSNFWTDLAFLLAQALILIYPLILIYLWKRPEKVGLHHSAQKAVMLACIAVVVALAIKEGMNFIYVRPRPVLTHPDLFVLPFRVDPQSFPSGHAMVSFVVASSLWLSGFRRLGGYLLVVAVLVALGRVLAGVHYPSDVLGGALIGVLTAIYLHREASSLKRYLPNN